MDWRAYFIAVPRFLEKANPYHKPRGSSQGGQFDRKNGWELMGFDHAGVQPTAAAGGGSGGAGGRVDFNSLPGAKQERLVKQALLGALRRGGSVNATTIAASVSQITGTLQSKQLAENVTNTIKRLQQRGEVKIALTTQRISSEGGHWVYKDVGTGKTVINPMTGKPARGSTISGPKEVATRDVHNISITEAGKKGLSRAEQQGISLNQSLSVSRPTKFDPVKGSLAEKALEIRQKTFPNSQLAPQGRVHSNDKNAPEMMTGEALEKKYKNLSWYDATSSARANVGAMTGNQELLDAVKLSKNNPKTPAMDTAAKLGLKEPDKPYYALLNPSNGKGVEITKDMINIGNLANNPSGIKDVVKSVDTPRLYGARSTGTVKGATKEILKQAGLTKPTPEERAKATTLAKNLVNNFKETPIAQFEEKFKLMAKEMPNNFVYTNPVSGFKMAFQKHAVELYRPEMTDSNGKKFRMNIQTPGNPGLAQSRNSTMPLFVQSFDAAVKDYVTVSLNNPYTKHDAFAVPRSSGSRNGVPDSVAKLKSTVADAYTKINKANPIGDLSRQMKSQWEKQIGKNVRVGGTTKNPTYKLYTRSDYEKTVKRIDNALGNFFPGNRPPSISIPPNTDHLELE